jgi:hypothetical protein
MEKVDYTKEVTARIVELYGLIDYLIGEYDKTPLKSHRIIELYGFIDYLTWKHDKAPIKRNQIINLIGIINVNWAIYQSLVNTPHSTELSHKRKYQMFISDSFSSSQQE